MKGFLLSILMLIGIMTFAQSSETIDANVTDTVKVYNGTSTPMAGRLYQFKSLRIDSSAWFKKPVRFDDSVSFGGRVFVPLWLTNDSSNKIASTRFVKQNSYTINSNVALKLNINDTAAMMAAAPRVQRFLDSVANLKTSIATKQNTLTLTTTGTSGAATFTGATLNIPQYSGSNIGNANLTLTGTRTLTNAGYQLSFLGGFESAVNFQNALKLETSTTAKESIEFELNNTYTSTGKRFRFRNLAAGYMDLIGAANTRIMTFNPTPFVTVGATVTRISDAMLSVYGSIATSQGMQITGSITSPTGSGIELENQGGTTYFTSYNRAGAWLPSIFRCGELNIQNGGTQSAKVFTNGNWAIQNGGTFSDIASARLQINSTTQGFLPPRMTTTQINAISSPALGLVVYNTTLNVLCVYTGTWQKMTTTSM